MTHVLRKMTLLFSLLVLSVAFVRCGGSASPVVPAELPSVSNPLGTKELAELYLTSTNLNTVASLNTALATAFLNLEENDSESENCHIESNSVGVDGQCVTPLNISGLAASINLGSSLGGGDGPARLFGGTFGASLDRNGEFEVYPFDFANPIPMQGESNLEDQSDKDFEWNMIAVYVATMDIKMQLKGEYWTLRYAFTTQSASNEPLIESCVDEHYFESIEQNSRISDIDFYEGDVMLCRKSSETDECADTDFLWLDLDTETFTATRPNNPFQHDWADNEEVQCEQEGEGYSISLGGYDIVGTIATPFKLSAELDACERIFTYTDPVTGAVSSGNTLNATFDYDAEDFIFIDTLENDFTTFTDAGLMQLINISQIWRREQQEDPAGNGGETNLNVTASISITNDDSFECEEVADVDDRLLSGGDCTPDTEIRPDCPHAACSPGFDEVEGTIWSVQEGGGCQVFCTRQSCDEYNGATKSIYCVPECD